MPDANGKPTFHEIIASIGYGAYEKHVRIGGEFRDPKYGTPVTINNQQGYANHLQDVINHPNTKAAYDPVTKQGFIYNKDLNVIIHLNSSEFNQKAGTAYRIENPQALTRDSSGRSVTRFDKSVNADIDALGEKVVRSRNPSDVKAIVTAFAQEHPFGPRVSNTMTDAMIAAAARTLEGRGGGPTDADRTDFQTHRQAEAEALALRTRIAERTAAIVKDISERVRAGATITDSPDGKVRTIVPHDPAQPRYEIAHTNAGAKVTVTLGEGPPEVVSLDKSQANHLKNDVPEQKSLGIRERLRDVMSAAGVDGELVKNNSKQYFIISADGKDSYTITRKDDGTLRIDVESDSAHGKVTDSVDLSKNQSDALSRTFRGSGFTHFQGLRNFATSVVLAVGLTLATPGSAEAKVPAPDRVAVVEAPATRRETPVVESDRPVVGGTTPKPPQTGTLPDQTGTRTPPVTGVDVDGNGVRTGGTSGSGGDVPRVANTGSVDGDGASRSRWQQAVTDAGGAKGIAAHVVGKAGYGISAFHLSQQLFGENSTLKSDLKNDAVRTRALTAVSLDAAVFATDTVIYGANAAKYLRHLDKLDDIARLASTSSKFAKFSRAAGPIGTVVSIGTSALDYSISETLEDGSRAAKAVGGAGGGLGGAGVGALIGSFICPGLGTAIGAGIGGLAGGYGGAKLAEHVWADDFQERFDDKALARLQENLGKLKGIGNDLEKFVKVEKQAEDAYKRLNAAYDGTDISKMDHKQILGIDAARLKGMDDALKSYQDNRREMARLIDLTMLTPGDQQTLDEVMKFVQERKAFLDLKEKHLRDAGDTDALARLAQERTKLAEAESEIVRWKGLNEAIAKQYGATSQDGLRKAEEELAPTTKAVADRKALVIDYQDKIRKHDAAKEQQTFERTLTQRVEKVNTLFNGGQRDDALMQRSAALLSLVESGEIDQKTFDEASAEIKTLRVQHTKDLAEMNRLKGGFLAMTKTEQDHRTDPYRKNYADHNLANLSAVNARMKGITDSFKVSQDVTNHTLKAAENAVALRTIADSGAEITGDTAVKVSGHIVNIARHTTETITLLSQDQKATAQALHSEWGKFQSRDVVNIPRYAQLREQSVSLVSGIDQKVEDIDRYQRSLRDTLENGYKLGERRIPLSDPKERQNMQGLIDRLETLKVQYSDESNKILQDIEKVTDNVNKRVLERGGATITLDSKGMVSSYSVGDKTITFKANERPLLVDANANIYNNTTSLKGAEGVDFYLYRNGVVTKMGETFQGTRTQDVAQLRTIDDEQARQQVQQTEKELTDRIKGKTIRNALSEMPAAAPVPQAQEPEPQASVAEPVAGGALVADNAVDNDPAYIEAAIALEKVSAGEGLDAMEKSALARILSGPDSNSAVVAALTSRYGDALKEFDPSSTQGSQSEGGVSVRPYQVALQSSQSLRSMTAIS